MIGEWLIPWYSIDREDERRALYVELQREVDQAHRLRGLAATAIGRRQDNDDLLFALEDGRMAIVHLTWIGKRDTSPFPMTAMYATAEAFVQDRMVPDHQEWVEADTP